MHMSPVSVKGGTPAGSYALLHGDLGRLEVGDGKAQIKDRSLGVCILNTADSKAKQRLGNAVFKWK